MLIKLSIWSWLEIRMQEESHRINFDNSSFQRVVVFKYLVTSLTY